MSLKQRMNEIPDNELKQFEKYIQIGKAGDVIIAEGEPNDNTLYLLRVGKIGIYRNIDGVQERITDAEAIIFFGEMELMECEGYRSATCSVASEYAIMYAFKNPDIKTIIKNPLWGEILITRLCQDLHLVANQNVQSQVDKAQVIRDLETMQQETAILLSGLNSLYNQVPPNKQDWHYVKGIHELVNNFSAARLPKIHRLISEYKYSALDEINLRAMLPDKLKDLLCTGKTKVIG